MFRLFAELIAFHIALQESLLNSQENLAATASELAEARETAELREQFIAVLGHDLRNPLASIGAGINLLTRTQLEPKAVMTVGLIRSSLRRMNGLIDNLLDFARGRLGGGLSLTRQPMELAGVFESVVEELRASHDSRSIMTRFALDRAVDCDPERLSQLLSNLLANALMHGADGAPVLVNATVSDDVFRLAVSNEGSAIPADMLERVFEPYERGRATPSAQGLGLGLFIASEIARAHGGRLSATSTPDLTTFTFEMPVKAN